LPEKKIGNFSRKSTKKGGRVKTPNKNEEFEIEKGIKTWTKGRGTQDRSAHEETLWLPVKINFSG